MDQHSHNHDNHHEHGTAQGSADEQAICPVLHIPVNKKEAEVDGRVRTYKGKTYYLCCYICTSKFDQNPEQYAVST